MPSGTRSTRNSSDSSDGRASQRLRRIQRFTLITLLLSIACSGLACRAEPAKNSGSEYHPFYGAVSAVADARGTLKGDHYWASSSSTREEAVARWREFLKKHMPPGGEFQDAFQRNYIRSAQYELMRLEYLLGHVDEGDALLKELEDVRGR